MGRERADLSCPLRQVSDYRGVGEVVQGEQRTTKTFIMFEKPNTTADISMASFIRRKIEFALEEERRWYKQYFKDRVKIIQRWVSVLPEEQGQELLKKIIK